MKKLNLSFLTLLAMGTFALAGGDIEPLTDEQALIESNNNFYFGLAYSYQNMQVDAIATPPGGNTFTKSVLDDKFSAVMLQAGYNFNKYIALEGRYWFGLSSTIHYDKVNPQLFNDKDTSLDAWGIYLKPQYPITEVINVYALLGYGGGDINIDNVPANVGLQYVADNVDGFSWGLGASYSVTENISLFVDYVSIYNDDDDYYNPSTGYRYNFDRTLDKWNFGLTYNF